jgi:6-phosphofructokinase
LDSALHAIAADADYVLIPEKNPADLEGMFAKLREVQKRRNYALVVVLKVLITPIWKSGPVKSPAA